MPKKQRHVVIVQLLAQLPLRLPSGRCGYFTKGFPVEVHFRGALRKSGRIAKRFGGRKQHVQKGTPNDDGRLTTARKHYFHCFRTSGRHARARAWPKCHRCAERYDFHSLRVCVWGGARSPGPAVAVTVGHGHVQIFTCSLGRIDRITVSIGFYNVSEPSRV